MFVQAVPNAPAKCLFNCNLTLLVQLPSLPSPGLWTLLSYNWYKLLTSCDKENIRYLHVTLSHPMCRKDVSLSKCGFLDSSTMRLMTASVIFNVVRNTAGELITHLGAVSIVILFITFQLKAKWRDDAIDIVEQECQLQRQMYPHIFASNVSGQLIITITKFISAPV